MINYLSSTFAIGLGVLAGIVAHEVSCRMVPRDEAIALQDWAKYTGTEAASFTPPAFALTSARALSVRSLLVGALTAILYVTANNRYSLAEPVGLLLVYGMIFLYVTLALTDLFFYQLPDRLTQALLWLGLSASIMGQTIPPQQAIAGAMTGYAALFLVSLFSKWWRGGEAGLGDADKKFLAAAGAWVGINGLPSVIAWASILAALHLICYRIAARVRTGVTTTGDFSNEHVAAGHLKNEPVNSVPSYFDQSNSDHDFAAHANAGSSDKEPCKTGTDYPARFLAEPVSPKPSGADNNTSVHCNSAAHSAGAGNADRAVAETVRADVASDDHAKPLPSAAVHGCPDPARTDHDITVPGNADNYLPTPYSTVLRDTGHGHAGHHNAEHRRIVHHYGGHGSHGDEEAGHCATDHFAAARDSDGRDCDRTLLAGHDCSGRDCSLPVLAVRDQTNHSHEEDGFAVTHNTVTEYADRALPIPFGPAIALAGLLTFFL